MEEEEISKRFVNFLRDRYYTKLLECVKNGEASLSIDFQILDEYDSQLTESLLYKPVDTIRLFEDSIKEIDVPLSEFLSVVVKQQMRLRFFNLPEFSVIPIRNLRSQHIGQFVSVEGTVRRASEILPAIVETTWLCPKCRNKTVLAQQEDVMKRPVMCDCGYQGKFDLVEKKLIDTRWITVEEPFELTEGERPSQLNIFLREDLTSLKMRTKTDPGNRLKITGVFKEVSQSTKSGKRSVKLGIMLEANHVESTEVGFDEFQITPEEEQKIVELSRDPEIYEKLIGSIAPSTYGLREIKEALALQLFSGVPHVLKDEIRIRGDIHILITGDPSTGKSQILKLVSRIANRGKYVSGKGVTGVGLTASVVKDEQFMGGWVLEAGAVVLCNKGLCSIDEFEKMHKDDQVALHEAMEQQSVSVAKATIVASLPAKTSILAAANPKLGRFDLMKSIHDQIDIPETLLSRFDLKFALMDIPNVETDTKMAEHILRSMEPSYEKAMPVIDPKFLRKYVAYARKNCLPTMPEEVGEMIKKFYLDMRGKSMGHGTISITPRQFEALRRLSEASAKVRLSPVVTTEDANRAIRLLQYSLQQLGLDRETGLIDIDRAEGGISSSQRNKIRIIIDIVDELTREIGKVISLDDIISAAEQEGISASDAIDVIDNLKRDGQIIEPKFRHIQKV